jgi:Cu(I)/Ag(I) efflux system membrane fusion protein
MHPTMTSEHPGQCSICQMSLVPTRHGQAGEEPPSEESGASGAAGTADRASVHVTSQKQQLIGVTFATVEKRPLARTVSTVGRVTYDERRLHHVHTKVSGWIEHLYAGTTGELVTKGQALMTIYSPELLASQEEYLLAVRARQRLDASSDPEVKRTGAELVASARRRLLLFDMTEEQVAELERTGVASRTTILYSPATGHIIERMVNHGEQIDPGTTVLDITDLSRVWVLADIYEYELPFVKVGQKATMTLSYLPGRTFAGRVTFIHPFLSEDTRTVKARLEFDNSDLTLRPEMFAKIALETAGGETLVVPTSAIVGTGTRDIVFVDRGGGHFEPKEVKVGTRTADYSEILSGLAAGERVVASGNFLIDSESRLKSALEASAEAPPPAHAH